MGQDPTDKAAVRCTDLHKTYQMGEVAVKVLRGIDLEIYRGQQQRVSIARALAKRPAIMLCDEPTGALDALTGQRVLGLLSRLNEEVEATIVIITHAAPIADMAHRVLHLTTEGITARENRARKRADEITW
jgi:putative ABC transport system ATP-binding protein